MRSPVKKNEYPNGSFCSLYQASRFTTIKIATGTLLLLQLTGSGQSPWWLAAKPAMCQSPPPVPKGPTHSPAQQRAYMSRSTRSGRCIHTKVWRGPPEVGNRIYSRPHGLLRGSSVAGSLQSERYGDLDSLRVKLAHSAICVARASSSRRKI